MMTDLETYLTGKVFIHKSRVGRFPLSLASEADWKFEELDLKNLFKLQFIQSRILKLTILWKSYQ